MLICLKNHRENVSTFVDIVSCLDTLDHFIVRSMIGSLLFLTSSHPGIIYNVCVRARYQAKPKVSHLKVVKRIIRYVYGTTEHGIWFSKDTNANLVGFSNSDWACDLDDRKSTSGGCCFLGHNIAS